MITTEEKAREKWCPFTRTGYRSISVNRFTGIPQDHGEAIRRDTRCIASHCMMWQWSPLLTDEKPVGYCGLSIGRAQA